MKKAKEQKLSNLSEEECYALLYGINVFNVPHYFDKVELIADSHFRLVKKYENGSTLKAGSCIADPYYFTLEDVYKKWFKRIANVK